MKNKNIVKLDTQGYYTLWQLTINNETCYNVSWKNEPVPDFGYTDPKMVERFYPVNFDDI